jgi:hypothetical protein
MLQPPSFNLSLIISLLTGIIGLSIILSFIPSSMLGMTEEEEMEEEVEEETPEEKPSGLTHKFRYAQDLYLSASVSFQKHSLRYGVTPFFVPNRN